MPAILNHCELRFDAEARVLTSKGSFSISNSCCTEQDRPVFARFLWLAQTEETTRGRQKEFRIITFNIDLKSFEDLPLIMIMTSRNFHI